jgi:hypothetical protein
MKNFKSIDLPIPPEIQSLGITSAHQITIKEDDTPINYIIVDSENCDLDEVVKLTTKQNIWSVYRGKKSDPTTRTDPPPEIGREDLTTGTEVQAIALGTDQK